MTLSREAHLVELVNTAGQALGSTTVEVSHRAPGLLHRAFSVLLVAPDGRILLQRRAAVKTRFPLRWANACCGHPAPGEEVTDAARQRLVEELGVTDVPLTDVGVYRYRAEDPETGRIEHEYDHVLLGELSPDHLVRADPDEVADLCWVSASELHSGLTRQPQEYVPWLPGVVARLFRAEVTPEIVNRPA